jgi:hypothetical protein
MTPDPSHPNPPRLDYAPSPIRPVSNLLWAIWLIALVVLLPYGAYAVYTAILNPPDAPLGLSEHRLPTGLAGAGLIIFAGWILWYVVQLGLRTQRRIDAVTPPLPAEAAAALTVCRKCGPFPTAQLVVTPVPAAKVWMMRAISALLLVTVVVIVTLYLMERIGYVFHAVAVLCLIVGWNMWRLAKHPTESCPTCASSNLIDGRTDFGKKAIQEWQHRSQHADPRG